MRPVPRRASVRTASLHQCRAVRESSGTCTSTSPQNDQPQGSSAPYLYFKAVAGQVLEHRPIRLRQLRPTKAPCPTRIRRRVDLRRYVNPKTYQLLCPGMDGIYGKYTGTSGIANCPLYPSGTNYDLTNGLDDMTNFTKGSTVGDDTQ